ncbi:lipid binding protein, putative [Ricinus communis]|uniref:Lipid binding protein, putative n=1 Tax=Ricinus communis TaxID=3988 RepID=B9RGU5_RICCO|nr:lipid binding protein, putative [Ricinus communis]|eukprot:XP_025011980.1 lipid transfer-like protein VAS [Ricinus communis]
MAKFSSSRCGIVALVLVVAILVQKGNGQDTSCINQLVPCLNYLNGTKDVPDTCCEPLENVIKSDPECLCSMISNEGSDQAEQAGINVTEAQQLPGRCGLHVNPISCITGSPNTKTSVDNSSGLLLFPSWSMMMVAAAAFSIVVQIFCV